MVHLPVVSRVDTSEFETLVSFELGALASLVNECGYELRIAGGTVRYLLINFNKRTLTSYYCYSRYCRIGIVFQELSVLFECVHVLLLLQIFQNRNCFQELSVLFECVHVLPLLQIL